MESKNNHLVRKYGFYYRYDTAEERAVLNRLWPLVNDRLNYLTPTIKPIGYSCSVDGRRRRLYDAPKPRWTGCWLPGSLSPAQNPNCSITVTVLILPRSAARSPTCRAVLLRLAKDKTEQLYLASIPSALPDVRKGIRNKDRLPTQFRGHSLPEASISFAGILT